MILSGPLTTPSSPTLRRLQSKLRPCNFVNFSRPVLEGADSSNASLEGSQCLRFSVSRWIFFTSKTRSRKHGSPFLTVWFVTLRDFEASTGPSKTSRQSNYVKLFGQPLFLTYAANALLCRPWSTEDLITPNCPTHEPFLILHAAWATRRLS